MKIVTDIAAQGDIIIVRVDKIPAGLRKVEPDGEYHVIAHSETGHHHVIDRAKVEVYEPADDEFTAYVRSLGDADLVHMRPFDTHETLRLPAGDYRVYRQREHTSEGWRRATD